MAVKKKTVSKAKKTKKTLPSTKQNSTQKSIKSLGFYEWLNKWGIG